MAFVKHGVLPCGHSSAAELVPPLVPPTVNITSPSGQVGGLSVTINATASATAPATVTKVDFYYMYCPGGVCGAEVLIGTDNTGPSPYTMLWTFPSCAAAPDDKFQITAYATDSNGTRSAAAGSNLRLTGRGC
jgi:hypothetical protein